MSDQMSRRGFMGAAATGTVALAGVALAGCSNTSASSEKSSEKEKAAKPVILVTSFGTSYNDSRHITIGAIEDAIREKYWQDYDIRRAFTAQIIIDKLKKRDGITIDNMTEALDRCVEDGVKEIVVQPTHLMAGLEYADVKDELDKYADKFDKISLGDPLLTSDDDYKRWPQPLRRTWRPSTTARRRCASWATAPKPIPTPTMPRCRKCSRTRV